MAAACLAAPAAQVEALIPASTHKKLRSMLASLVSAATPAWREACIRSQARSSLSLPHLPKLAADRIVCFFCLTCIPALRRTQVAIPRLVGMKCEAVTSVAAAGAGAPSSPCPAEPHFESVRRLLKPHPAGTGGASGSAAGGSGALLRLTVEDPARNGVMVRQRPSVAQGWPCSATSAAAQFFLHRA